MKTSIITIALFLLIFNSNGNHKTVLNDVYQTSNSDGTCQFPGGKEAFDNYLNSKDKCGDSNTEVKVYVQFIIDELGKVSDVKAIMSPTGNCKIEAEKLISNMPKWEYTKEKRISKKVRYVVPVFFNK